MIYVIEFFNDKLKEIAMPQEGPVVEMFQGTASRDFNAISIDEESLSRMIWFSMETWTISI